MLISQFPIALIVAYVNKLILDFFSIFRIKFCKLVNFHALLNPSQRQPRHQYSNINPIMDTYMYVIKCYKMWREITYPFPISNGAAGEIWKWQNVISSHTLLVRCAPDLSHILYIGNHCISCYNDSGSQVQWYSCHSSTPLSSSSTPLNIKISVLKRDFLK